MARVHLVLLHGEILDSSLWGDAFLKELRPWTVTTVDLLGHGRYERRSLPDTFDQLVQAARARFLVTARPDPEDVVVLVGHSLGAWIAARWALHFQGVDAVCAIGSVAGLDLLQIEQYAGLAHAIEANAGFGGDLARVVVRGRWMPGLDTAQQERFEKHLRSRRPAPTLAVLRMLMCTDPVALSELDVPWRAVRGAEDQYAAPNPGEHLIGRSHFPHLEQPGAVAAQVQITVQNAIVRRAVQQTWLHGEPQWMDAFRSEDWVRADPWHGETDLERYQRLRGALVPMEQVSVEDVRGDGESLQCRIHLVDGDRAWDVFLLQTWVDGRVHRTYASYPRSLMERTR